MNEITYRIIGYRAKKLREAIEKLRKDELRVKEAASELKSKCFEYNLDFDEIIEEFNLPIYFGFNKKL